MEAAVLVNMLCTIVLCILLFGMNLQRTTADKTARKYTALLLVALFFVMINLSTELADGNPNIRVFSYIVNWLSFLSIDLVVISFISYLYTLTESVSGKKLRSMNIAVGGCIFRAVLVPILMIFGKIFTMDENGFYVEESLAFIPYMISFATLTYVLVVVILHRSCFTKQQFTVIVLYQVMPIIPVVVESYTHLYSLTSTAITMSILMIYVFIQAVAIEQSKVREAVLLELSSKDLLTDLGNRRAYYSHIEALQPTAYIGAVFCDINGLKYTNDHFGHAAGDTLIQNFAHKLTDFFPKESVYRISGDEFVVILPAESKTDFEKCIEAFRTSLQQEGDPIAAVGYSYGTGSCIGHLVSDAETMMYADKSNCNHSRTAVDSLEDALEK